MNFRTLHAAEHAAQDIANMAGDRMLIYKPRHMDSYEVVRWNMADFENQNYVSECAPNTWGL